MRREARLALRSVHAPRETVKVAAQATAARALHDALAARSIAHASSYMARSWLANRHPPPRARHLQGQTRVGAGQ